MPAALPTTLDPPFLAPLECVVDLPMPPTTNKIWTVANGKIVRSRRYTKWKDDADVEVVVNGSWRRKVAMPAAFKALILIDRIRGGDIDNRIKAVLDWAQSRELITDDRLCEEITARWSVDAREAPTGCRLILRSIA